MKRLIIMGMLAAFSHVSNGQSREEIVASKAIDTTNTNSKIEALQQRLAEQEQETESLKKNYHSLKQQVQQNKSRVTIGGNRTVISRKGSKQVISE